MLNLIMKLLMVTGDRTDVLFSQNKVQAAFSSLQVSCPLLD